MHDDVKIVELHLDTPACYVPAWNTIFVDTDLSPLQRKYVLKHELEHIHQSPDLYSASPTEHIKLEFEANCQMVSEMLDDYMEETGQDINEINYAKFMETSNINSCCESAVKYVLSQRQAKI